MVNFIYLLLLLLIKFSNAVFYLNVCLTFCSFSWNEWLLMPLLFSDLPRNAQLAITIYDCVGPGERRAVGGTTISLFGKNGVFRRVYFFS